MRFTLRWLGALALGLMIAMPAAATVRRSPVKVQYVGEPRLSALDKTTTHMLEIVTFEPDAVITGLTVESRGWTTRLSDVPLSARLAPGTPLPVQLEATPVDPLEPVILRFEVNGKPYEERLDLGPSAIERARRPRPVKSLAKTIGAQRSATAVLPSAAPAEAKARAEWMEPGRPADDSPGRNGTQRALRTIRVHGRFVYERSDGTTIGADGVTVRVYDEDDLTVDPLLASGITDSNGDYDVSFTWDGSCFLCESDPDIYVEWESENTKVEVEDATTFETNYRWESGTTSNFSGTDLDKGTSTPADESLHPALHILTDLTRNWRWYLNNEGYDLSQVDAQWPEPDCAGAWYDPGPNEMHICTDREWREDTHAHEYGHHWMNIESESNGSDYCNGICDTNGCGHCIWCQETAGDAWQEGWPNWIAHVQTTSYAASYGIASVNTRDQELVVACDASGLDPANLTEGFIGAFLQDVWDSANEQDTLATSTWSDRLSWGTNEIFDVVDFDEPLTPLEFINDLKDRNPSLKNQIWETAKNSTFEVDALAPSTVTNLVSTSHTIGVASPDPTITFTWTRADDDWSGPDGYSVRTGFTAVLPDAIQDIEDVTTYTTGVHLPGTYWFTIRTLDRSGKWDGGFASSGPYVIREPEPADLEPFLVTGWDHELVPRASADAGTNDVPAPTMLFGDSLGTYWNFHGHNSGESATSTGLSTRLYVDGASTRTATWSAIPADGHFAIFNGGPFEVPSGRHTFSAIVDVFDAVAETNESNNTTGRQWIWKPLRLAGTEQVTRDAPPDRTGGWDEITEGGTFFNADGLRFSSGGSSWWHALVVHNEDTAEDYDCRLHFATQSPDSGFGANIGYSTRNAGEVDAVIVNRNTVGDSDWDVGVINAQGGVGDYTARHVVSNTFAFEDSTELTIPADRMLLLREVFVPAAGPVSFTARITSGTGPVKLLWLDETFTTGDLLDYDGSAVTQDTASTARIDVTLASAGYNAFVLYRDPADGTGPVTVLVEVEATPADLRAYTPLGWYSPLVPRPAMDGVIINVPAPDTLHGNVASTWLNFGLENDSPTAAPSPTAQVELDGAPTWGATFSTLAGGDTRPVNGSTARSVRGGRHTLAIVYDAAGAIDEKSEDNNAFAEQWVWSPLRLALNTPVSRPIPPDRTGGWEHVDGGNLWFNCDGLRSPDFAPSGSDGWWAAIAAMPGDSSDVNLRLHEPQPSTKDGFRANLGVSSWGVGESDFNLVNLHNTALRTFDVGVTLGEGSQPYVAEAVRSVFRGTNPDGVLGPFTLGANRILQLHEFWLDPGTWTIDLLDQSGTVDWGMTLHEPATYLRKSGNIAASYLDGGVGAGEQLTVTTLVAGYYCVAVWKVGSADLPLAGSYRLGVGLGTVDAPAGPVARTAFSSAHPNPTRGHSTLAFALAEDADTQLEILDLQGARVRTLAHGRWPAGRHTVEWRGDDDKGRSVAPGVYLVRFRSGSVSAQRKLVRIE